jgi:hypothetical protein
MQIRAPSRNPRDFGSQPARHDQRLRTQLIEQARTKQLRQAPFVAMMVVNLPVSLMTHVKLVTQSSRRPIWIWPLPCDTQGSRQ